MKGYVGADHGTKLLSVLVISYASEGLCFYQSQVFCCGREVGRRMVGVEFSTSGLDVKSSKAFQSSLKFMLAKV
jgi:hypothetical protein